MIKLSDLLSKLSSQLQEDGLWQNAAPTQDQLSSSEPFSVDRLAPEQWLQWVFIPNMQSLIETRQVLPKGFSVTPYFEECWKNTPEHTGIIETLREIDKQCQ